MTQYISKSALVAEIEKLKSEALQKKEQCKSKGLSKIVYQIGAYNKVLSLLDTLEVKEADLEEEITSQIRLLNGVHTLDNGKQWWKGTYNELYYFAEYFFELGLKAKGE